MKKGESAINATDSTDFVIDTVVKFVLICLKSHLPAWPRIYGLKDLAQSAVNAEINSQVSDRAVCGLLFLLLGTNS